jgi:hypothetical protein
MSGASLNKCQQCGLIKWQADVTCERCGADLLAKLSQETVAVNSAADVAMPLQTAELSPAPLASDTTTAQVSQPTIGGWLVFPAIGLTLGILRVLNYLGTTLRLYFGPRWQLLTVPGERLYHPLWKPLFAYEIIGNTIFLIVMAVIAACFFQKKRITPKLMVAFIPASFLFTFCDHLIADQIPSLAATSSHARIGTSLMINFVLLHVWIPYFLVSKRVQATFVK